MLVYAIYRADGSCEIQHTTAPIKLELLQKLVGGNIEAYRTSDGADVYINEEGRLEDLPSNPFYAEDLRGTVIECGGVDTKGDDKGLSEDYVLRNKTELPEFLFKKGEKVTIFYVGSSMPMTAQMEIKMQGYSGDYGRQAGMPVFRRKNKRKDAVWSCYKNELMIFKGWELPFSSDVNMKGVPSGNGFTSNKMRMNALFNLGGMPKEELAEYIETHQSNPFFMQKDRINFVDNVADTEELLFVHEPASCQLVADMQMKQTGDNVQRIVV